MKGEMEVNVFYPLRSDIEGARQAKLTILGNIIIDNGIGIKAQYKTSWSFLP